MVTGGLPASPVTIGATPPPARLIGGNVNRMGSNVSVMLWAVLSVAVVVVV